MGIALNEQEVADHFNHSHTLIFSCVEGEGCPHSTPVRLVYKGCSV